MTPQAECVFLGLQIISYLSVAAMPMAPAAIPDLADIEEEVVVADPSTGSSKSEVAAVTDGDGSGSKVSRRLTNLIQV